MIIKKEKLPSTPEIEKAREAYKSLRKTLKGKGVDVAGIGLMKRKGIFGIKINLNEEEHAKLVPLKFNEVPVYKIGIIPAPPVEAPRVIGSSNLKNSNFKIETVKWSWAAKVQNKGVYRDDEFVRTKTKEEALEAIGYLMAVAKGLTYTITVFRDGEYFTYFRHSQPCLGALCKYRDSHGPRYSINPYFPRDIYVAFPEGDITYIACHRPNSKDVLKNPSYEFIFSQESPWVSAFGSNDTIIFENNHFVLTNMNTDPTVFYSLMRQAGFASHGIYGGRAVNNKFNPRAEMLFSKSGVADPRRLAGQKPIRISGGTWAEGFGFTRPYNESIFKTSLPHKFADFGKLKAYPQAPFTNTYFVNEMKKVFGVDIKSVTALTPKLNDVLVESWEYFRAKSKELDKYDREFRE